MIRRGISTLDRIQEGKSACRIEATLGRAALRRASDYPKLASQIMHAAMANGAQIRMSTINSFEAGWDID